jgi:hypothetical protein
MPPVHCRRANQTVSAGVVERAAYVQAHESQIAQWSLSNAHLRTGSQLALVLGPHEISMQKIVWINHL